MQTSVMEGSWEEIASHAEELAGQHVRLIIIKDDEQPVYIRSAHDEMYAKKTNRTVEQLLADRARLYASSRPPRELPPGKTLQDVIVGKWPGDETDEQISAALRALS